MLGGVIRGTVATLRTPREDDLAAVNAWMADLRVQREGGLWGIPAMPATWKERLKEAAKDQWAVLWIVEAEGAPAGLVHLGLEHDGTRAWIQQLVVAPERWGRGIGSDTAVALHRFLFDYLDLKGCGAEIAADNTRALRIAEKLGYREFGRGHEVVFRDGAYADLVFLRLDRGVWNERFPDHREYEPFPEGIER